MNSYFFGLSNKQGRCKRLSFRAGGVDVAKFARQISPHQPLRRETPILWECYRCGVTEILLPACCQSQQNTVKSSSRGLGQQPPRKKLLPISLKSRGLGQQPP